MDETEDIPYEEVSERNHMDLNALIELLIRKKVISQEELDKKLDELYPDEDDDTED